MLKKDVEEASIGGRDLGRGVGSAVVKAVSVRGAGSGGFRDGWAGLLVAEMSGLVQMCR